MEIEGREKIWEMAEKLNELHMKEKNNNQATERYKLIVSETTWILWKCRNESVICQNEIQPSQIKSRWVAEMNNRIKIKYVKNLKKKEEDKSKSIKSFK